MPIAPAMKPNAKVQLRLEPLDLQSYDNTSMWKPDSYIRFDKSFDIPRDWLIPDPSLRLASDSLSYLLCVMEGNQRA